MVKVSNLEIEKDSNRSFENYLISGRFALILAVEIGVTIISLFTVLYFALTNPYGFDWGIPLSNSIVLILFFIGSTLGLVVSLLPLFKLKTDLKVMESKTLSLSSIVLILNPPYSLVAIIGGFLFNIFIVEISFIQFVSLFYSFGLGLLFAHLLFFVFESRYWSFTPNKNEDIESKIRIISYTLKR